MRENILNYNYHDFLEVFKKNVGKSEELAKSLYKDTMQKGYFMPQRIPGIKESPRYLQKVQSIFFVENLKLFKKSMEGDASKFVFKTKDGHFIESVIIPMKTYNTLCISSQVGCRMGCLFCQTGKMKLLRNLTVSEIVSQLYFLKYIEKLKLRNIVFMGMGEPLDNMENVMKAIDVFSDDLGFNLKKNHITVSTCGLVPKIEAMSRLWLQKCMLAVSINTADDSLRNQIMPINKKYNLKSLKSTLAKIYSNKKKKLFVEYVLLKGVNDSLKDASKLKDYLTGLPVRINLIPYNKGREFNFERSSDKAINAFFKYLVDEGLHVIQRKSKGHNLMGGCGQLGG